MSNCGRIEVICGSMFSGKSEELIRRVRRATFTKQKIQVFKPTIDNRYGDEVVCSHNGNKIIAQSVANATELMNNVNLDETNIIAIDEVQFFDNEIIDVCQSLANSGCRVIVAGLDLDFRGEPFGPMPGLMAIAEDVQKLQAICQTCGENAWVSQRLIDGEPAPINAPTVSLGASESYEARCRTHYKQPIAELTKNETKPSDIIVDTTPTLSNNTHKDKTSTSNVLVGCVILTLMVITASITMSL